MNREFEVTLDFRNFNTPIKIENFNLIKIKIHVVHCIFAKHFFLMKVRLMICTCNFLQ